MATKIKVIVPATNNEKTAVYISTVAIEYSEGMERHTEVQGERVPEDGGEYEFEVSETIGVVVKEVLEVLEG